MVLARRCCRIKIKPGDRLALLAATWSEAPRDAPVLGSSPFGGELLPGVAPDEIMTPNLIDFARADRIKRTI
jgi:hypothetical protein